MGQIKYVQLESGGFLADPDFQLMNSSERGIYCSIIFYMYLNDGKILNDPERIKKLCNADESFEKNWETVEKNFIQKNGYLTHKRVRKELTKAQKYFQTQRNAGLRGAEKRWAGHSKPNGVAIARPMANKVKKSKVKKSKGNTNAEMEFFDIARTKFPGRKNGLEPEFANFCKKHKDRKEILPLLLPAIEQQIVWRKEDGQYWKNFQTWINQSCWTEEKAIVKQRFDNGNTGSPKRPPVIG